MQKYEGLLEALRRLHDNDEHFAYSLLGEGMRRLETVEFGEGKTVVRVVLIPCEDGEYDIEVYRSDGLGVGT